MTITQQQVKDLFDYSDGVLMWKNKPACSRRFDGSNEAGTVTTGGYKKVVIGGKKHYVHRLIFLMHNGYLPDLIDHADGNSSNNKIENLREADKSKNAANSKLSILSTSGHRGVTKASRSDKWYARVQINKKSIHLGTFDDFEFACFVADEARRLYFGKHSRI
jgi:hypothetical protein